MEHRLLRRPKPIESQALRIPSARAHPPPARRAGRRRRGAGRSGSLRSALALVLGSLLAVATILILAVGIAVGMGVGSGLLDYLIRGLPAVDQAIDARVFRTATVYDRQGRLLDEVWDPEGGKRTIVPLSEIPSYLVDATLATEDPRFYENPGFDAAAIVRALWQNVSGQSILSGASTITQQLVRNSLFTPAERYDRSYVRKAKEVVLAYELSRRYTKDEILGRYLNEINYGNLAYGVEAAAQTYFGKSAGQLTIAEAALLAGLPQAPYAHDPLVHPEDARARQLEVLGLMVRHGYLAASAAEVAAREELHFQKPRTEIRAPHFAFYVRSLLEERYSRDQIYYSGLRVYTTLDLDLQDAAERAAQRHLATLRDQGAGNAAVVAIDPRTGEILAMLGSADYWDDAISGQINMALAPRPPASALKPFTYLTAFARNRASPGSVLLDEPTSFSGGAGAPAYRPENADGKFRGPVTARRALANSLNVPTVRLLAQVGVPALLDTVHELGVTTLNSSPEHYGLSLALGSGEVRLLDLTYAYAALANGGLQVGEPVPGAERLPGRREFRPVAISRVEDDSGKVLEEYRPSGKSVVSPQAAWLVTDILADAAARAETAGDGLVRLPFPAATQVGASEGFENSWAFGYTPGLAVGVWVGNASNQPMRGVTGLTGAAPIWRSVVEAALRGQPYLPFSRPTGLVQVAIDPRTGLRPGPGVPAIGDWFVEGNVPKAWAIPTPTATPLPTPTPRPTPTPMPRPTPTPAPTPTSGQVPSGMILVPSFVGMPEADARRLAGSLGLGSADTNYQTAGDVADKAFFASIRPGSVLSQIPAPGSIVAKGTTLYIAVRKE